jgi:hypothetical protein
LAQHVAKGQEISTPAVSNATHLVFELGQGLENQEVDVFFVGKYEIGRRSFHAQAPREYSILLPDSRSLSGRSQLVQEVSESTL